MINEQLIVINGEQTLPECPTIITDFRKLLITLNFNLHISKICTIFAPEMQWCISITCKITYRRGIDSGSFPLFVIEQDNNQSSDKQPITG